MKPPARPPTEDDPERTRHGADLEASFFAPAREGLRERLQEVAIERARQMESLAEVSGIEDVDVLEKLVVLGLSPEALSALTLYPLVAVAWADGRADRRERDTVLAAALECGLERDGVSYHLLEDWLEHHPPDALLLDAWKAFVRELSQRVPPDWRETFEQEILSRAHRVANATGGFLALDKTSSSEEHVLDELRAAFSGSASR